MRKKYINNDIRFYEMALQQNNDSLFKKNVNTNTCELYSIIMPVIPPYLPYRPMFNSPIYAVSDILMENDSLFVNN